MLASSCGYYEGKRGEEGKVVVRMQPESLLAVAKVVKDGQLRKVFSISFLFLSSLYLFHFIDFILFFRGEGVC